MGVGRRCQQDRAIKGQSKKDSDTLQNRIYGYTILNVKFCYMTLFDLLRKTSVDFDITRITQNSIHNQAEQTTFAAFWEKS